MHVFQPIPIDSLELNPFNISGESGVAITCEADGIINATSSPFIAFGKVWNKKVVVVFVRENRYTKELLEKSDFFSVSFFEDKHKTSVKYLKSVSGKDNPNKITDIGFHVNKKIDIPFIDEGNFILLCSKLAGFTFKNLSEEDDIHMISQLKEKYYKGGNHHHVFIGEILEVVAR